MIGDTPHGAGSRNDPTSLTDVSSVSGAKNGVLLNQDYTILNQGQIQSNNNSGNGYTTTNWTASSGNTGAIVNGDHVTWQGIWLEHFKKTADHLERRVRERRISPERAAADGAVRQSR